MKYGEKLKQIRQEHGISQAQLSKATGIPQQTISWCENDKGLPNIDFCFKIADYYGLTVDELFDRDFTNK